MKLKLIVLAGSKEGLEIPLKKDKFLIGRAKECALRAGSEAISRRHCAIIHREKGWTVRDLGSRNGTYVNDEKITKEVPLNEGDQLRVGPLSFRVAAVPSKEAPAAAAPQPQTAANPAKTSGSKKPPVKDVADVVDRTISPSDSHTEDDVSNWLLDLPGSADTLKETRSMRAEETSTAINKLSTPETTTVEDISKLSAASDESKDASAVDEEPKEEGGSGVWKFFKRGNKAGAPKKAPPGKLPPRAVEPSKDSRDAAADILREMQRRR
jgi:pSer/pThr/pTyr-binding forkhead associated (FHA) protein